MYRERKGLRVNWSDLKILLNGLIGARIRVVSGGWLCVCVCACMCAQSCGFCLKRTMPGEIILC